MGTVNLRLLDESDPAALFCHYDMQTNIQPCYIELDEDGDLTASYTGEVGPPYAVPESVWHRRTQRWTIPCLTAKAANELLREILPLAQRLYDGLSIEWDGNNHVGHLDKDAQEADDEIESLTDPRNFDDSSLVMELDAGDWWSQGEQPPVTAISTDEELLCLADEAATEASDCYDAGYCVLTGAYEFLSDRRKEAQYAEED
jgi:hypothetical protein